MCLHTRPHLTWAAVLARCQSDSMERGCSFLGAVDREINTGAEFMHVAPGPMLRSTKVKLRQ